MPPQKSKGKSAVLTMLQENADPCIFVCLKLISAVHTARGKKGCPKNSKQRKEKKGDTGGWKHDRKKTRAGER